MTDERIKLLTGLETKVRRLTFLYENVKNDNKELISELEKVKRELSEAQISTREWETKYQNLLLARVVSVSEQEVKKIQSNLSKLEREIEKCIAQLNE